MGYTFNWNIIWRYIDLLYSGILVTISVSIMTIITSIALGVIIAVGRIRDYGLFKAISTCYVELIRNTPLLIQMFFIYFGLAQLGVIINPFFSVILALTLHYASYAAEIIRANIQSLGNGQSEAALALGMTKIQAMIRIILPQAMRRSIPALGNQLIYLIKDSSLMAFFGMKDLMYAGIRIQVETWRIYEGFITIGLLYLLLSGLISILLKRIERKIAI